MAIPVDPCRDKPNLPVRAAVWVLIALLFLLLSPTLAAASTPVLVFGDSFANMDAWTTAYGLAYGDYTPWKLDSSLYTSAPYCAAHVGYSANEKSELRMRNWIDLTTATSASLTHKIWYEVKPGNAWVSVMVESDEQDAWDSNMTYVAKRYEGSAGAFLAEVVDLSPYVGHKIRIYYTLNSGMEVESWYNTNGGVAVDDVELWNDGVGTPTVDTVTAAIDSVSPNPATPGATVAFVGRGTDSLSHGIVGYEWRSSPVGVQSTKASFSTSFLSEGTYTIYLKVKCANGTWSPEVSKELVVSESPSGTSTRVYRFRNLLSGFYLWSLDPAERTYINTNLSATWKDEGVAYPINTATNTAPLYRFRNIRGGYYLYTADPAEKNNIVATLSGTWQLEGPAYDVSTNPGGSPVWRFRNLRDGTYLLSADPAEKNTIAATLSATWFLEGPAFYLAQ